MKTYNAIAVVDLDDTLFQTLRKCPPDVQFEALTPMAWGADGQPISYATPVQINFIRWLEETTLVIAATARSTAALLRTHLRFEQAVTSHGAVILNSHPGSTDNVAQARRADWHEQMECTLRPYHDDLIMLRLIILKHGEKNGQRVRTNIIHEDGLPLYLVIKHQDADGNDAELLAATLPAREQLPDDWTAHINGNNVAFLPPGLGKAHAVREMLLELRVKHPQLPIIGIGDSHTDADFMALCDFAMTPTKSQLSCRLFENSMLNQAG